MVAITEALTFDDVLLLPRYSSILPSRTNIFLELTKKISLAIIKAIKYAKKQKSKVISILGKKDGYAALNSTISIVVDPLDKKLLTPISESYQGVIWHLLVSHPLLQKNKTKW